MSITLEVDAAGAGKRLDWFLHERLPGYSRSRLQSWIKEDRVRLNGAGVRASYLLRGGEQIEISPAELPPLRAVAQELPLTVLYEDGDVVVIDKPAGMVVHAGAGHHEGTLVNALLHRFGPLSTMGGDLRPGIVHRLDKDTSGVLVVARTDRAHQSLAAQFQSRDVEKIYLALVHGHPAPAQGVIRKPVARDPVRRTRMTTRLKTGRAALTEYRTIEEIGSFSLLEIRIGTGRTHQIRVHLSSIGHPIAGDTLYGAPKNVSNMPPLGRFFLHAASLRFESPSQGTVVQIQSPLAGELEDWLARLRVQSIQSGTHNNRGS
jgi:23S rRNA pseudouridine1911/1915/1917 synthase